MTLYKKSTKVYLTLVHFIFLNDHIDFISKKESFKPVLKGLRSFRWVLNGSNGLKFT